ncbi:hypothetical protein SAY87_000498 [Trapa incisa]|uniref:Uncharacterized protein n=1 Tax=Trapa incisa TaxID=236973 RepID=A0AAN7GTH9_9MYRT|nr:hypothetical protein SAY87_000498 [Trapa incisa]
MSSGSRSDHRSCLVGLLVTSVAIVPSDQMLWVISDQASFPSTGTIDLPWLQPTKQSLNILISHSDFPWHFWRFPVSFRHVPTSCCTLLTVPNVKIRCKSDHQLLPWQHKFD